MVWVACFLKKQVASGLPCLQALAGAEQLLSQGSQPHLVNQHPSLQRSKGIHDIV